MNSIGDALRNANWDLRYEAPTPQPVHANQPFYTEIQERMKTAMSLDGRSCRYCGAMFEMTGALYRHFDSGNPICNRSAYTTFNALMR